VIYQEFSIAGKLLLPWRCSSKLRGEPLTFSVAAVSASGEAWRTPKATHRPEGALHYLYLNFGVYLWWLWTLSRLLFPLRIIPVLPVFPRPCDVHVCSSTAVTLASLLVCCRDEGKISWFGQWGKLKRCSSTTNIGRVAGAQPALNFGGGQLSWNFIRWRYRAYSTVVELFRKRSQKNFSLQHFRKWELFSFNQYADWTIRTE